MSCLCKSDNGGRGALDFTVLKPRPGDKRLIASLREARIRPKSRANYATLASLACGTKRSIECVRYAAPRPPKSLAAPSLVPRPGNESMYLRLWLGKRGYAATRVALAALS